VSLFEVARTIQLKGLCTPERAAASLRAAPGQVEALIAANEPLFKPTPRGMALTPEGRAWVAALLRAECAGIEQAALEPCYARFSPLNQRFKRIVSEWQLLAASGGQDETKFGELVAAVRQLHEEFAPVVIEAAACAPRLTNYGRRFEAALAALAAGDASMLASPLKDSYHTVWFEFHEELIALSGRDRAGEET
jgi:pyruvate,orthophosphate dikinase